LRKCSALELPRLTICGASRHLGSDDPPGDSQPFTAELAESTIEEVESSHIANPSRSSSATWSPGQRDVLNALDRDARGGSVRSG
jgi:hypothetical protein